MKRARLKRGKRNLLTAALVALGLLSVVTACDEPAKPKAPGAASAASAVASAAPSDEPLVLSPGGQLAGFEVAPGKFAIPVGPRLFVEPGKGVGPIRFGATTKTIERLMDLKCQIKTATQCTFITAAIEFKLKDGALVEILIHRIQRPSTPDRLGEPRRFGIFNGALPKQVTLGMYRGLVMEAMGTPLRVDAITEPNPFDTFEVAHFDGVSLEFDRLANGNNVLGGVILRPAGSPLPPVSSSPLSAAPAPSGSAAPTPSAASAAPSAASH